MKRGPSTLMRVMQYALAHPDEWVSAGQLMDEVDSSREIYEVLKTLVRQRLLEKRTSTIPTRRGERTLMLYRSCIRRKPKVATAEDVQQSMQAMRRAIERAGL